jgi:outer membrane protein assembly factor BamB
MLMTRNWIFLLLSALLLGGCSWFTWLPWVDGDDDEEDSLEPASLVKFDAEVNIKRVWKAGVGEGLGRKYLRLNPVVLADRIYAADGYGRLQAHDRFTGKRLWQAQIATEGGGFWSGLNFIDRTDTSFVSGGVGAGGGNVLLGTTDGEVIAFSAADGSERWRGSVGSEVLAAPVVGDDLVFVQSINGRLIALEQDSGEIRWSFDNQVPVLTLRGTAEPVFDSGVIYAGFANGTISALRAESGEPIWEHRVMLPEGRSELDRMVDVDSSPLVRGQLIYCVAYQGKVKAIRRSDGQRVWELDLSSHLDLGEGYGQIYVVNEKDAVVAIDQQSAQEVWRQDALYLRRLSSPLAFSNYLAVGDSEGYLHILAQSDGRFLARRKLDGDGLRSGMTYIDGTLYVLGNSGSLHALEITVR